MKLSLSDSTINFLALATTECQAHGLKNCWEIGAGRTQMMGFPPVTAMTAPEM